jgi:hypothetical protein
MHKPKMKLRDIFAKVTANRKLLVEELKEFCVSHRPLIDARCEHVKDVDVVAAIRVRIEQLAAEQQLGKLEAELKETYSDVFKPIPHVDEMPDSVLCKIKLKDTEKTISTRSYSCPHKFCEAWGTLIQRHLDARRI